MNKKLKIHFILLILLTVISNLNAAQVKTGKRSIETMLAVGEELTYVVKYSVMRLGEIKLKIVDRKIEKDKVYYSAVAEINSYPSVPFVTIHQVYETTLTPDLFSKLFVGSIKHDDYTSVTKYIFNYDSSKVYVTKGKLNSKPFVDSVISISKKYQDGISLLYYARLHSGVESKIDLPTLVNEKKVITGISFTNKIEDISIDAVDYDVDCYYLEGKSNYISIFGLTGDFEGWFSNDDASIPIKAKMKVLIGNITIELKNWKRKGWSPPRYRG